MTETDDELAFYQRLDIEETIFQAIENAKNVALTIR